MVPRLANVQIVVVGMVVLLDVVRNRTSHAIVVGLVHLWLPVERKRFRIGISLDWLQVGPDR